MLSAVSIVPLVERCDIFIETGVEIHNIWQRIVVDGFVVYAVAGRDT